MGYMATLHGRSDFSKIVDIFNANCHVETYSFMTAYRFIKSSYQKRHLTMYTHTHFRIDLHVLHLFICKIRYIVAVTL